VLIKQLIKKSAAGVELRQHNPDQTFTVGTDDLSAIVKVVGELI
jgi:phage repressor protein C with HTH and peptisase S24 domain